jgi:uncharacterized protein (DUF362 family)
LTKGKISRRAFIRLAALTGIGAGIAIYRKLTAPVHPVSYLRWKLRGLFQQNFGEPAVVGVERCSSYSGDLSGVIGKLWLSADIPSVVGKNVFIKPNMVDTLDGVNNITTAPHIVAALIDILMERGAKDVKVGDGPAFRRDAFAIARNLGLDKVLAQRGVPFIDLNYDDPQPVHTRDGWFPGVDEIWLPRSIIEADIVFSLAKLKTHHWAQVSLTMKNLLGIFPGAKYGWPKNFIHFSGIPESIMGIYQVLPDVVGFIDGVVGMQGDGPLFGSPTNHGVLIAGADPVAVDMVGKNVMGFDDWEVGYLNLAAWAGIGQATKIVTRGVPLDEVRMTYQRPPKIQ